MTEHPTQATEFSEFDLRLEAKAGTRIRIGGSYKTSSSVNVKPQTGKRRSLTREGDALSMQLDPDDYAKLLEKCAEKGRLKVKMKGHLKQRRAQLCGNQSFTALFVASPSASSVLHAIDATPARWRGDAGSPPPDRARTAASSPREECRPLISTQARRAARPKRRPESSASGRT